MSALRIYVPGDAAAVACGADEIAAAIKASATKRKISVEIVRNGSRGMHWLEPMVEVATGNGRIAYGPVELADVDSVLDAMLDNGADHKLRVGVPEDHPFMKRADAIDLRALRHRRSALARRLYRPWRLQGPRQGAGEPGGHHRGHHAIRLARPRRRRISDRHQVEDRRRGQG